MSARQLIILAVAFVAAIGALLAIRGMNAPRHERPTEVAVAGQTVLVMARDVPQGAALQPGDLAWRVFPTPSIGPQFVTQRTRPEALNELNGGVTRRAFAAGEPVLESNIVLPEGRGFLAAQLQPGYRAVSVEIEFNTAAGGFIQPNDRVDVVVTYENRSEGGGPAATHSDVVLRDVRVLALDDRTQTQAAGAAPERIDAHTAVLELTSEGARRLALADAVGTIHLMLRPVEAGADAAATDMPAQDSGGAVIIHSFGRTMGGG